MHICIDINMHGIIARSIKGQYQGLNIRNPIILWYPMVSITPCIKSKLQTTQNSKPSNMIVVPQLCCTVQLSGAWHKSPSTVTVKGYISLVWTRFVKQKMNYSPSINLSIKVQIIKMMLVVFPKAFTICHDPGSRLGLPWPNPESRLPYLLP